MQKTVREDANYAEDIETNTITNDRSGVMHTANAWILFYGRKLVCSIVSGKRTSYNSVANDDLYDFCKWRLACSNEIWNNHDNYRNMCYTV